MRMIERNEKRARGGFTLLEVVVALTIGVVIVGGVMGLISSAMNYNHRLKSKTLVQPILEAAAQEILADPHKAEDGALVMGSGAGGARVNVDLVEERVPGSGGSKSTTGRLYRVILSYGGEVLEFSVLIREKSRL